MIGDLRDVARAALHLHLEPVALEAQLRGAFQPLVVEAARLARVKQQRGQAQHHQRGDADAREQQRLGEQFARLVDALRLYARHAARLALDGEHGFAADVGKHHVAPAFGVRALEHLDGGVELGHALARQLVELLHVGAAIGPRRIDLREPGELALHLGRRARVRLLVFGPRREQVAALARFGRDHLAHQQAHLHARLQQGFAAGDDGQRPLVTDLVGQQHGEAQQERHGRREATAPRGLQRPQK